MKTSKTLSLRETADTTRQASAPAALGQRVQDYQGTGTDSMTLTYPIDIFGQRTGTFAQWPSQNWTGWNVYWSQVAGQRLNMGGADAYIDHSDAVGSTTMETDPAGGVQWKIAYYPWGQILAQGGIRQSVVWAGLDWQVNDPSYPSATREYNDSLGRWLTPDPGGVKVVKPDNPQTWNMYAYVTNNPTSLNDPSGLQSNCANGPVGGNCSSNGESFEESTLHTSDARQGIIQAVKGGLKVALGVGLIATAAGGDVPGGVVGALLVSSGGIGGSALTVSGTLDIAGAATKTDVRSGQDALEATGNLAGLSATAVSGGNLQAGRVAATVSDVATLSANPREAVRNAATTADAVRTMLGAAGLLHNYWNDIREVLPSWPVLF